MGHRFFTFLVLIISLFLITSCKKENTTVVKEIVFQELTVQTPEVSLYTRIAGNVQSGNVLIAINGGPGLSSHYMLGLEDLAGENFAVVTYDQRGVSRSSAPPRDPSNYTFDQICGRPGSRAKGSRRGKGAPVWPLVGWIGGNALCSGLPRKSALDRADGQRRTGMEGINLRLFALRRAGENSAGTGHHSPRPDPQRWAG